MSCETGHCITCSDEAIPMRVLATVQPGLAVCATQDGAEAEVMTDLVEPVSAGDQILVHAGTALTLVARPEDMR